MKRKSVSSHMKFMRLLMFGTVMLMANGAGAQNSVKPFHLDEATISDVHAAYKSGALTSVRLVQAYLERIRACDQAGPKLNVLIFLNPRALEEAAALDEHFRRTGHRHCSLPDILLGNEVSLRAESAL